MDHVISKITGAFGNGNPPSVSSAGVLPDPDGFATSASAVKKPKKKTAAKKGTASEPQGSTSTPSSTRKKMTSATKPQKKPKSKPAASQPQPTESTQSLVEDLIETQDPNLDVVIEMDDSLDAADPTTTNDAVPVVVPLGESLPASGAKTKPRPPTAGGKGKGKGKSDPAKRHRKVMRDNLQGITKPAIRRLARRGGVKRLSGLVYEETRGTLKTFLTGVISDAILYTEYARRRTVTAKDVVYALKKQGRTMYL